MHNIPYSTQDINDADARAVLRTLRSGWITQGPAVERFERSLAKRTGARYAIALNSGTAALHAAYFAAGLGKGDEIVISALTFAATANAALYLGAKPVFADIDIRTGNMSAADAEKKITKRTKALVPVDYSGRPAALRELKSLARKRKLVLIEDAAQALGATYRGKPVGSIADMTIFSFHPVKSITTGEGGAVVTNNKVFAERVRLFRTHGITKDPRSLVRKGEGAWHQEMQLLGYNYRLTDIQAALGESQLRRLDSFIAKRRAIAQHYGRLLAHIKGLTLPPREYPHERSAWHLYPVRVSAKKRAAVFKHLRGAGIGVQVHHVPVYLHPYYRRLGHKKGSCMQAERFYREAISIPIFPALTEKQQRYVTKVLRRAIG